MTEKDGEPVSKACGAVNMSRQNFYAQRKARRTRKLDSDLVVTMASQARAQHPRMGVRKLHRKIAPKLKAAGLEIGRDAMFDIFRERGMLVEPSRPEFPRTTNSYHNLPVFTNLIKGVAPDAPNQQWSADLTYLRTREGWMFMALIMDRFSRKIVGWDLSDSLEREGCVRALRMALRGLVPGEDPIHHSDRGCQYCSHEYYEILSARGLKVSMTETNHCAENAMSERLNGILKQEYGLGLEIPGKAIARDMAARAVWLYNYDRPHQSLGYECPEDVHRKHKVA